MFTWAPSEKSPWGHSAIATQIRHSDGTPTGYLEYRDLWPADSVKDGEAEAAYPLVTLHESRILDYKGVDEKRLPDGILRIEGDAAQDRRVQAVLNGAALIDTYDEKNTCASFTQTGIEATGIDGGDGAQVTISILGFTVYSGVDTTPVSLHNAVAESGDERVSVIKALPEDKRDPTIQY